MAERPTETAVAEALGHFRGAMRPFILRQLRKIPGGKPEDHARTTLRGERANRLDWDLEQGRDLMESLDVGDFAVIIKRYWAQAFRTFFAPRSGPQATLQRIVEARNRVAHPGTEDINIHDAIDWLKDMEAFLGQINTPEAVQAIAAIRERFAPFEIPAHRFRQGERDVYSFTIDIGTLDALLPERVDEEIIQDANRPLTLSHAASIQSYLLREEQWLLGALLLGVSPDLMEFQAFADDTGAEAPVGLLTLSREGIDGLKIFDGQHRRRAIRDALRQLDANDDPRYSMLASQCVPIILYAEGRGAALRQMFADAAKTRRIEQNALARFDLTNPFNIVAARLEQESNLFAGLVEMERASVPRSSEKIIAINQLAMCLKTLEVGINGRVRGERTEQLIRDIEALEDQGLEWADEFLPTARDEYTAIISGDIDAEAIPQRRTETMAYNATVIRLLAGLLRDWGLKNNDWTRLAQEIRAFDLQPAQGYGSTFVDFGIMPPGATSPQASTRLLQAAISNILKSIA